MYLENMKAISIYWLTKILNILPINTAGTFHYSKSRKKHHQRTFSLYYETWDLNADKIQKQLKAISLLPSFSKYPSTKNWRLKFFNGF